MTIPTYARHALFYLLCSAVYIITSDIAVGMLIPDASVDVVTAIQISKGVLFVAATTYVIFRIQRAHFRRFSSSEERYRSLFANNPNPMWVFDLATLQFLDVNAAAAEKYGYSREEFLRMSILDIRPVQDAQRIRDYVASLSPGMTPPAVWRHVTKDGTILHVSIRSHDLSDIGLNARLIVATDLTEIVNARSDLDTRDLQVRETMQRLQALADATHDGLYIVDAAQNVVHANRTFSTVMMQRLGRGLGVPLWEVFPEQRDGTLGTIVRQALDLQMSGEGDFYRAEEGRWYRVVCYPVTSGAAVLYRDITAAKLVDLEAQQRWANMRAMIDSTPDMVYSLDREYRLTAANEAFFRRVGQLVGIRPVIGDTIPPAAMGHVVAQEWRAMYDRALAGEAYQQRYRLEHTDGSTDNVVSFTPIRRAGDDGVVDGICVLIHNVTALVETERRLVEQANDLRAAVARYERLSLATNDAVWDLDITTGRIRWSGGIRSIFGHDVVDTPFEWLADHVHTDDRGRVLAGRRAWLDGDAPSWSDEYRLQAGDGSYRWVFDRGIKREASADRTVNCVGAVMDVTERREVLQHLRRQNDILLDIAHISAHDIRGPLSSILGLITLLEMEDHASTSDEDILRMMKEASLHLDTMIHRIVARTNALEIVPLDRSTVS